MWWLRAAMRTWPGSTRSPSLASLTRTWHSVSSRSAKARVKCSGMCCTTTMPGASAGRAVSTSRSASVPPVEAPRAITLWVASKRSGPAGGRARTAAGAGFGARTRAWAAASTLATSSSASSMVPSRTSIRGLVTKSTAPSSRARSVVSAPRSVSDETMSTGMGRSRISFSRKVSPSIRGISTSSVSTSGCSRCTFSQAA